MFTLAVPIWIYLFFLWGLTFRDWVVRPVRGRIESWRRGNIKADTIGKESSLQGSLTWEATDADFVCLPNEDDSTEQYQVAESAESDEEVWY